MSRLYTQHKLFSWDTNIAFGGSGGGSPSSSNSKSEQVYVGGSIGYVDKKPTTQDRNDNFNIASKSGATPPPFTRGQVATGAGNVAGAVGLAASRTNPVGIAASAIGLAANNWPK